MKKILATLIVLIVFMQSFAQVGIGNTNPNPRAALDITDSTRGLLIPRMTMVQRLAISNTPQGLMVYQTDSTKGFWYFENGWRNINASPNYGGKHTIVLSDSITDAQAIVKLATEVGPNTQELRIEGCVNLTTVDLSVFVNLTNLTITDNVRLRTVNLQNLKSCEGYFSLNNCPSLTDVNVNSLEKILYATGPGASVVALYISNIGWKNISFPKLRRVLGSIALLKSPAIISFSLPLLTGEIDNLRIGENASLKKVSFPNLQSVSWMFVNTNNTLDSLSFPNLSKFTSRDFSIQSSVQDAPNLTSLVLGNLTLFSNYGFQTLNTKLPSDNINDLLHKFVGIGIGLRGRDIRLVQNVAAPPTGQGISDKAQLVSQGNNVSTN